MIENTKPKVIRLSDRTSETTPDSEMDSKEVLPTETESTDKYLEFITQYIRSQSGLPPGGGGGGMEARVAKLEASVEHIQTDIYDIKNDVRDMRTILAEIKESIGNFKVDTIKWFIGTALALLVAAIGYIELISKAAK